MVALTSGQRVADQRTLNCKKSLPAPRAPGMTSTMVALICFVAAFAGTASALKCYSFANMVGIETPTTQCDVNITDIAKAIQQTLGSDGGCLREETCEEGVTTCKREHTVSSTIKLAGGGCMGKGTDCKNQEILGIRRTCSECEGDLCNSGTSIRPSLAFFTFMAAAVGLNL